MTERITVSVLRCDLAPAVGTASVIKCESCGEDCWFTNVTRELLRRDGYDKPRFVCGCCELYLPELNPGIPVALPIIPRLKQFFPPKGHTLVSCKSCNEPGWADALAVQYGARVHSPITFYCTDCVP